MKRSPLRRVGRRGRRDAKPRLAFRKAILARCHVGNGWYQCERCGVKVKAPEIDAHHRKGRNLCTKQEKWSPDTGAGVCAKCHRLIHDHWCSDWKEWLR